MACLGGGGGGVSNVADSNPNLHIRSAGGRLQLNNFVCLKSKKYTLFCSTEVMLAKSLVYMYIHHCVIQSAIITCILLVLQ